MHLRRPRNDSVEVVQHLVTGIGPRRATSVAEAQAAAYIDGRLRRAGMRVSADTFVAPAQANRTYALLSLLGLIAAVLTYWLPWVALMLALLGLALATRDALARPLPTLAIRRDSQNIIGTQASEKTPRWRVVVLAPLDSLPDTSGIQQLRGNRRVAVLLRIGCFGVLSILALMYALDPQLLWIAGQILLAVYLLLVLLPVQQRYSTSPGGAGALAVLLAAAERLSTLRSVELWTIAVGATANSSSGLQDMLARYPFPKESTLLLVLEAIEPGQLTYASREGIVRQRPADAMLTELAASIDAADPTINAEPRPYTAAPSMAAILHRRGYRALTILTHQTTPSKASGDNVLKQLDPSLLERATRLVVGIVQQLDTRE